MMDETRTIKELLTIVREKLPRVIDTEHGGSILGTAGWLWNERIMTLGETWMVGQHMLKNVPDGKRKEDGEPEWWPRHELEPRIEYLDKLIAELE